MTGPVAVGSFATCSLRRLGVEAIALHRMGCPDPWLPCEDAVGAADDLNVEGEVRDRGASGAGVDLM